MANSDIADGKMGTVTDVLYTSFIASSATIVPLTSTSLLANPSVASTATSGTAFAGSSDNSQAHGNLNLFQDFNGEDMEKKNEESYNRGRDARSSNSSSSSSSSSINRSHSEGSSGFKSMTCCEKGTLFVVIEQMLQTGRREEAALLASKNKEWALALLIASNCGTDTYKEVSRAFASSTFPSSSPLHLATLLFSSQVNMIRNI